MGCDVRDSGLADTGRERIEWAAGEMPVLALIRERFEKEKPLAGCADRGVPARDDRDREPDGDARCRRRGGRPLCVEPAVDPGRRGGGALRAERHRDVRGEGRGHRDVLPAHQRGAGHAPAHHDGRRRRHGERPPQGAADQIAEIIGGTEETTTGVIRLRAMAVDGALKYAIVCVNDADTKHLFDNRFGTGQSTIDAIMRSTNRLLAGRTIVVCGYGMCGRGVASRASGMGAHVIVDRGRSDERARGRDGGVPRHADLREAARVGDIFVTVTGDTSVIRGEHMELMKDGAIMANSGHFDVEIDKEALAGLAVRTRRIREFVDEYTMADGRRLHLLGEGRLVNLSAAEGHPAAVMDMSFANQALAAEWVVKHQAELGPQVYPVPVDIDKEVARLKLHAMGVEIDTLTAEQDSYLHSWQQGT